MNRTEKMIAAAETNGRWQARIEAAQIACDGVPAPARCHYAKPGLRAAWQRGYEAIR